LQITSIAADCSALQMADAHACYMEHMGRINTVLSQKNWAVLNWWLDKCNKTREKFPDHYAPDLKPFDVEPPKYEEVNQAALPRGDPATSAPAWDWRSLGKVTPAKDQGQVR